MAGSREPDAVHTDPNSMLAAVDVTARGGDGDACSGASGGGCCRQGSVHSSLEMAQHQRLPVQRCCSRLGHSHSHTAAASFRLSSIVAAAIA